MNLLRILIVATVVMTCSQVQAGGFLGGLFLGRALAPRQQFVPVPVPVPASVRGFRGSCDIDRDFEDGFRAGQRAALQSRGKRRGGCR